MKVVIHAADEAALGRARIAASDLLAARIPGMVRMVANEAAAGAAVASPEPEMDRLLILCGDSLARLGLDVPRGVEMTPNGALLLAQLQRKGWTYLRA